MSGDRRQARNGRQGVGDAVCELVPDDDGRGGLTVLVGGVPSSHVDPGDPTRLDFEYMRWIGDLLDVVGDPGAPLRAVHLGGAGCTLPRYLEATRPGSVQIVYEVSAEVVEAVRRGLGLRSTRRLRIRVGDGRAGLAALADGSQDVVVRDAFSGDRVPGHLVTRGFLGEVARVLAPGGLYVANLADAPPLTMARAEAATAGAVFDEVGLVAEPAQFKGRRYGNVVLVASRTALPVLPLARRLASGAVRARLLTTAEVRAFCAGTRVLEDADPPA